MTCYQRHLAWLFEELDLPYEAVERRYVDDAIRRALSVPDGAHCPEVWSAVKRYADEDRERFIESVRAELAAG